MRKRFLVFFCFVVCCLKLVNGQPQNFNFSHLNINNGLSHNQVNAIYKDSEGFMWFGTLSGLNRYDGYDFKIFKHHPQDSSSLVDDYISNIFEGPERKLWVLTRNGVNIYDPVLDKVVRNITPYLRNLGLPTGDELLNVRANDGVFWFLFKDAGLYRHNPKTKKTTFFFFGKSAKVTAIASFGKNYVWAVMASGKAVLLSEGKPIVSKNIFNAFYSQPDEFTQAFADKDGDLYLYSTALYKGVYHYSRKQNKLLHLSNNALGLKLNTNLIRGIVQADNGVIWIATDHGGVNLYDKAKGEIQFLVNKDYDAASISQNSINSIYKDTNGFIWLGTFKKGISYYHPGVNKFKTYTHQPSNPLSLPYSDVNTFAEDKRGNIWIGTNGGGLMYWERNANTFKTYKHTANSNSLSNNVVVSLCIDHADNLWIGTYYGGLDFYDGEKFKHFGTGKGGLTDDRIFAVKEDSEHHILVGTLSGGLNIYYPKTGKFESFVDKTGTINSDYVSSILEKPNKTFWIGTSGGVNVLQQTPNGLKQIKSLTLKNGSGLSNNNINTIIADTKENIWIGTREGLNVFSIASQKIKVYRREDGLPDNNIQAIKLDDKNNVWVSTSRGISKLSLPAGDLNKAFFTNYDELDGLQGLEFNLNSAFFTSKNELIFGGANGFNIFKPSQIIANSNKIEVAFTGLQVLNQNVNPSTNDDAILNKSINLADRIKLHYDQNVFSISFTGFNYFNPEKVQYAYQLEGFDKHWINTGNNSRKATYTNLDAGEYTFKVRASTSTLNENSEIKTINILILPPFYETPLAYFLYALAVLSLLFYLRQRGINKLRKEFELQQERQEAQRIHDVDLMKIKFFTNVSHEFRTPLSLILAPVDKFLKNSPDGEEKQQYELIRRNARRLLNLVNQLMDFRKMEVKELRINPKKGNIVQFIKELSFSFTDIAEKKHINFQFESEIDNLITLYDEEKLERIMFNLLSNAFKFTYESGCVSVHLGVSKEGDKDYLQIRIIDTGIGIPKSNQAAIFENFFQNETPSDMMNQGSGIGLSITKEFVKLHGGRISVESEEEVGSCFLVELPIKVLNVEQRNISESRTVGRSKEIVSNEDLLPGLHKKPLILLVEDNEDFRFYLKENLGAYFRISEASDGQEGWQKVLSLQPQLVVSDISMPRVSGIELCRKIKEDERTKQIPVVLLTAQTTEELHLIGLDTGASDYLTKPFNFEILLSKLKNILLQQQSYISTYKKQIDVVTTPEQVESAEEKLVRNALRLVEENILNNNFSVEELSRELNMSRVALYKKLLAITGQSPVSFIRSIRLKKAVNLIEDTDLSLSEIAYRVGFNNPKYFTKSFKQEFGITPSEWQKKEES